MRKLIVLPWRCSSRLKIQSSPILFSGEMTIQHPDFSSQEAFIFESGEGVPLQFHLSWKEIRCHLPLINDEDSEYIF